VYENTPGKKGERKREARKREEREKGRKGKGKVTNQKRGTRNMTRETT